MLLPELPTFWPGIKIAMSMVNIIFLGYAEDGDE